MSDAGISDLKDCVEHTFIDHLAGEWKGEELAGGCVNNQETWLKNPSFVMDVKEDTDLDIIINQGGHSHAREAIGFALFKGEPPYLYNMAVNDTMWNQDTFTGKIEAGTYVCSNERIGPNITLTDTYPVVCVHCVLLSAGKQNRSFDRNLTFSYEYTFFSLSLFLGLSVALCSSPPPGTRWYRRHSLRA